MPIYEYLCHDFEERFQVKATIQEKEKVLKVNCPDCSSQSRPLVVSFCFPKVVVQDSLVVTVDQALPLIVVDD